LSDIELLELDAASFGDACGTGAGFTDGLESKSPGWFARLDEFMRLIKP